MAIGAVSPHIDETHWPVVVVTMPRHSMSDDELRKYLDRLTHYCTRGQPFVLVVDVRAAATLAPMQRRILADQLDLHAEEYPNIRRGVAIVLSSAVHRGIVKVFAWLTRKPLRIEPFGSIELAMAWASSLLLQPTTESQGSRPGQSKSR